MTEVETALEDLMTRPDGPFVAKLAREPGRRESRYMHLFSGDAPPLVQEAPEVPASSSAASTGHADRLAALEQAVDELRHEVAELKARVGTQDS